MISSLKSLEKLYLTNNICESIHRKIVDKIGSVYTTKLNFRETIKYILKNCVYNNRKIIRKDYLTRTMIIIVEKYNLNDKPKFIDFKKFKKELETTISLMTKKNTIKTIEEIIIYVENIEFIDEKDNNICNNNDNKELNSFESSEENESNVSEENNNIIRYLTQFNDGHLVYKRVYYGSNNLPTLYQHLMQ